MAVTRRKGTLVDDPRYVDFVLRYRQDPLRFAVEVTGFMPSGDQMDLFRAIAPDNARVSVVSGTGCFAKGTMMMRSNGDAVAVEDVRPGDRLMGPDGMSVRNVLELRRGREPMYRFTYEDGLAHTFNESHILTLMKREGAHEILSVTVREWLTWAEERRRRYCSYRAPFAYCRGVRRLSPDAPTYGREAREGSGWRYRLFEVDSVEFLGEGDYYGFVLDGDHRFLAHDFTVLHNTGKTASFARIALWHLLCFPFANYGGKMEVGSNTYIGAPLVQQVADGVWKEMQDTRIQIARGPHAWLNDYYEIGKTRVTVKGFSDQWFITQLSMAKGVSVGVAGKHRYWQLIIIDEAAGVPDEHFNVIDGTQTQPGNRTLMASQGVRTAGRFYDSHHILSKKNGGSWVPLRFSSERAPWVTKEWLDARALESGGKNSVEYQIRVLGLFAQSTSNVLLTRPELEKAFEPRAVINSAEEWGYVILVDVAMGEYRDETVVMVAKVIGDGDSGSDARRVEFVDIPICANDKNPIDLVGDLIDLMAKLPSATLYVDAGGSGAVVCKLIESQGVPVGRINWGAPCFRKEYKDRFYNMRACAMVRFRDAIRTGRVLLPQNIPLRTKEKILDEGTRLPYHFSEAGGLRYVMENKADMRKEGIKSPDLIDAMAFCFLEGSTYMASGESSGKAESLASQDLTQAEELFAGI